jgi:hypothetical protein
VTTQQFEPGWASKAGLMQVKPAEADSDPYRAADRLMIAECIHRYGWGYDERDADLVAGCFTPEGVWEGTVMGSEQVGPFEGREAIVAFLAEFWAIQKDQRRHIFTNVVVDDLNEDSAVAHAYLLLTSAAGSLLTPVTNGPYRLIMRKDAGVWRMAHLISAFDAPY